MDKHLTSKDFEIYTNEDNFSLELLDSYEQIDAHLEKCEECQKKLLQYIYNDAVYDEENMADLLKLASKEDELKRRLVADKLLLLGKNVVPVVQKLIEGECMMQQIQRSQLMKQVVWRGGQEENADNQSPFKLSLADGKLIVEIADGEKKEVILSIGDKVLISQADWDETKKCFIVGFDLNEDYDDFQLYFV